MVVTMSKKIVKFTNTLYSKVENGMGFVCYFFSSVKWIFNFRMYICKRLNYSVYTISFKTQSPCIHKNISWVWATVRSNQRQYESLLESQ